MEFSRPGGFLHHIEHIAGGSHRHVLAVHRLAHDLVHVDLFVQPLQLVQRVHPGTQVYPPRGAVLRQGQLVHVHVGHGKINRGLVQLFPFITL